MSAAAKLDPAVYCGCGHHADEHDGECLQCVCPGVRLHWSRRSRYQLRTQWTMHPRDKYEPTPRAFVRGALDMLGRDALGIANDDGASSDDAAE